MKTTTPGLILWWWYLWWCCGGGGVVLAVTVVAAATTTRHGNQQVLPLISEEESQLILKRTLHETAATFERNLRGQLSDVETEIYGEFLSILEDLGNTHENLTLEVSQILRLERTEVLRKVKKVTTYSSILVENLYRDLRRLLQELGLWTEDPEKTSVLFSPQQKLSEKTFDSSFSASSSSSNEAYRNKRHMLDWDLDSDNIQNLVKYEPFDEEDLAEFLMSSDHNISLAGFQDDQDTMQTEWMTPGISDGPQDKKGDLPRDCLDLLESGIVHDGLYTIYPTGLGVRAWCDMGSLGGGWTVVVGRRARQPDVNFSRPLLHYQFGFGDPETHHWLGLDHMHALTHATNSTLLVHLHHHALPSPLHATYHTFRIGSREERHRLTVGGYDNKSTAADALSPHDRATFTCPDPRFKDHKCVEEVDVGWWFLEAPLCYLSLPTGQLSSRGRPRGVRGSLTWLGMEHPPETLLFMIRRGGHFH